jgi:hypothetical protein
MGRRRGLLAICCLLVLSACQAGRSPQPNPGPPTVPLPSVRTAGAALGARAAHTATGLDDGSVLVAGGCNVDGCTSATSSAILLDVGGTIEVGSMYTARDAHTAIGLESGQVLVAGGFAAEGQPPLASGEVYDPSTRTWTSAPAMTLGRGGHAAARLADGRVVEIGGWVGPHRYTATTEIYDPQNGRFELGATLPIAADSLAAVTLADGTVLVTGGQVRPGVATASAAVLSSDGKSIQVVGPLRQPRFKHTMVRLPSGQVLVIGGAGNNDTILSSTEIYDPQNRRFRPGPTMTAGRYKLTDSASVLPDGRVVVAGGGPGLEIIDPLRRSSKRARDGGAVYASFSTASVVGDTVWVVGGYDRAIRLTYIDLKIPLSQLR